MSVNNNVHIHGATELTLRRGRHGGYIVSTLCPEGYVDLYIHSPDDKMGLSIDLRYPEEEKGDE